METIVGLLALAAFAVSIIGWLWICVMAFSEGETIWGIGCLIISPVCLIYGFLNFQELKIPLFMVLGGLVTRIAIGLLATSLG